MLFGEILFKGHQEQRPVYKKRNCAEGPKYMEIRRLSERQGEEDRYQNVKISPTASRLYDK